MKLRQSELALRVGVTPGAINKIESGESKGAKPATLAALAQVLGVSMEWLATGREGYVLEPSGEYASAQVARLVAAWGCLPLSLRLPLLTLIESIAGVDKPSLDSD